MIKPIDFSRGVQIDPTSITATHRFSGPAEQYWYVRVSVGSHTFESEQITEDEAINLCGLIWKAKADAMREMYGR